ncbi:MAG: hypothetical protein IKN71_06815 [Alphaproteobacteria bacterium]|nr:hypothetical protein [Alphaproteobacteria bacterium]
MLHFADLTYSREELEEDAVHFFETQVYMPAFVDKVKEFIADDLCDFKNYYDDNEYAFQSVYYDEYVDGYVEKNGAVVPQVDLKRLSQDLESDLSSWGMSDEDVEQYTMMLEAEFRKNAFCSHMEPYFLGYDGVVATVVTGYSRDPLFSIYSLVREWAMALHFKKMYPQQMRSFGYRYQTIRQNFRGEERLKRLIDFRDKYKRTIQTIGILRAVHSSVFAYVYLYLKGFLLGETEEIEDFIMDTATSQIYLLLQGEDVPTADFPIVKHALQQLKSGRCKELINHDATINWDALYDFVDEMIKSAGGMENLRSIGFDGIAAKTIRSFWNKSANMQKMLKILRQLAMGNSDPIINRLIEMCEYRLGRPSDKSKKKMERFIEYTRKLLAAHAYELTKPRTMDQTLIAAFPSVFLVYFQWHHSFRTIYPKVPKKQVEEQQNKTKQQTEEALRNKAMREETAAKNKQQAEDTLKNTIAWNETKTKAKNDMQEEALRKSHSDTDISRRVIKEAEYQSKNIADENKMRTIMQNREKTLSGLIEERSIKTNKEMVAANILEQSKRQNSL